MNAKRRRLLIPALCAAAAVTAYAVYNIYIGMHTPAEYMIETNIRREYQSHNECAGYSDQRSDEDRRSRKPDELADEHADHGAERRNHVSNRELLRDEQADENGCHREGGDRERDADGVSDDDAQHARNGP